MPLRTRSTFFVVACFALGLPHVHAQSPLEAGLGLLKAGVPGKAADQFHTAVVANANDTEPWIAYGALFLDTGSTAEARRCFARAAALNPALPLPPLGRALCDLADGKSEAASASLQAASNLGADVAAEQAYLAMVQGGKASPASENVSLLAMAVDAFSGANPSTGLPEVLQVVVAQGRSPLLATFDRKAPLARAWAPRSSIKAPELRGPTVHGDFIQPAPNASGIDHATFSVDGQVVNITNTTPYEFRFNTAAYPNGWHSMRATSYLADGRAAAKDQWVKTENANAPAPRNAASPQLDALLRAALTMQPDARAIRFSLAATAASSGDKKAARGYLEDIVADAPEYRTALADLKRLAPPRGVEEIWRGPAMSKRIALTFDDGPNPRRAPALLDLLDRLGVKGTFFVVGREAAASPDIIRRMAKEGHDIEDHSWSHPDLSKLSSIHVLQELALTRRLLAQLTGRRPRYFRPPGGNIGAAAHSAAALLGMTAVMWTFNGGVTEGMPVEDMVPKYVSAARPGAIVLIHNGTDKIEQALPLIVAALRAKGYTFVTVSELLGP